MSDSNLYFYTDSPPGICDAYPFSSKKERGNDRFTEVGGEYKKYDNKLFLSINYESVSN